MTIIGTDMRCSTYSFKCARWSYEQSPTRDPEGLASGASRVVRGGGWLGVARDCRAAFRIFGAPVNRDYDLGFRLARSAALGP